MFLPLPDEQRQSVYDLDLEQLRSRGIRGIIFDLDNTLGPWGFTQWENRVLRWLSRVVHQGFSVGYLSNDPGEGRHELIATLDGQPVVFDAGKPRSRGFQKVLQRLSLPPERSAMVGDQLFTDVWGAKRLGMYTVLVQPVDPSLEGIWTRARRRLERLILRAAR